MPRSISVKVIFTCDRSPTQNITHECATPLEVERLCTKGRSEAFAHYECAQVARSAGWRISDGNHLVAPLVLCSECNQTTVCEHGYDASWPDHKTCNGR